VVDNAFWRDVLAFAQQHDLLLIHDNPYQSQVCFRLLLQGSEQLDRQCSCVAGSLRPTNQHLSTLS
jgi:hypothetical protein